MLKTERLLIRSARADDLADLHRVFNNADAMAHWHTPPHPDPATTKELVDRMLARTPPITYFVLELQSKVIGVAGLHGENEVGFIIHSDNWRKGLVREAMQAIIPYIWATTDVDHLAAGADPDNSASIGLLKALGFHEIGREKNTHDVDGKWTDSVYFRLNRP